MILKKISVLIPLPLEIIKSFAKNYLFIKKIGRSVLIYVWMYIFTYVCVCSLWMPSLRLLYRCIQRSMLVYASTYAYVILVLYYWKSVRYIGNAYISNCWFCARRKRHQFWFCSFEKVDVNWLELVNYPSMIQMYLHNGCLTKRNDRKARKLRGFRTVLWLAEKGGSFLLKESI